MEPIKSKILKSGLALAILASSSAFATGVTSGQLVIVNGLGNVDTTGHVGSTASSVSVVVSDSTGPCSTTTTLTYNGTVIVKWAASNTHSATACTNIASVAVTPLKTTIGTMSTIVYDSVSSTAVPATAATAAVTFTPPTTSYVNLALIVTGTGSPSSAITASSSAWGVGAASAPVFDAASGSLTTVGVPGASGSYGINAEQIMRQFAVLPSVELSSN
jgi:hypothetical protein